MPGAVIPKSFWNTYEDFSRIGAGFTVLCNQEIASTAFSAFVIDDMLEIGIESIPHFRGNGLAQIACSALIDYCLDHKLEPVWACRLENKNSLFLAEKLGLMCVVKCRFIGLAIELNNRMSKYNQKPKVLSSSTSPQKEHNLKMVNKPMKNVFLKAIFVN